MRTIKTKVVLNVKIARKLIQDGYRVVDIKPNHSNPQSTVFVFADENGEVDDIIKHFTKTNHIKTKGE